jgi:hypothetical protein
MLKVKVTLLERGDCGCERWGIDGDDQERYHMQSPYDVMLRPCLMHLDLLANGVKT